MLLSTYLLKSGSLQGLFCDETPLDGEEYDVPLDGGGGHEGLLPVETGVSTCAHGGNLLHTLHCTLAAGVAIKLLNPSSFFVNTFENTIPSNKPRTSAIPICILVNFMKSSLMAR